MRIGMLIIGFAPSSFAGIAAAALVGGSSRPVPSTNPEDWITIADLPAAVRDGVPRMAVASMTIDRSGAITACTVEVSSKLPQLDTLTCTLLNQRARFKSGWDDRYTMFINWPHLKALAAWDRDGPKPPSRIRSAVAMSPPSSWVTPEDYPGNGRTFDRAAVKFNVEIDPAGKVTSCSAKTSDNSTREDMEKATCAAVTRHAHFWPALDQAGKPVHGVGKGRVFWSGGPESFLESTPPLVKEWAEQEPHDLEFRLAAANMPAGWRYVVLNTDLLIGPDGKAIDCSVTSLGADNFQAGAGQSPASLVPLVGAVCKQVMTSWTGKPVRDLDGRGVISTQRMKIGVGIPLPSET